MTAQHDIRLFLADVDGALVTKDKVLTEAAKAAVRELDQAGIAFAITSGRPRAKSAASGSRARSAGAVMGLAVVMGWLCAGQSTLSRTGGRWQRAVNTGS